jgi:hypothetical protein
VLLALPPPVAEQAGPPAYFVPSPARIRLRARPRILRVGRPARVRVRFTTRGEGIEAIPVRFDGEVRGYTDERGVARFRYTARRPGRRYLRVASHRFPIRIKRSAA